MNAPLKPDMATEAMLSWQAGRIAELELDLERANDSIKVGKDTIKWLYERHAALSTAATLALDTMEAVRKGRPLVQLTGPIERLRKALSCK